MSKKTSITIAASIVLAFFAGVTSAQTQTAASAAKATAAPTLTPTPAGAIDVHEDMVAKCLAVKREVAEIATGRSKIGDLAVADRQSAKDALDKRARDAARISRELKCGSGSGQKPAPLASSGQKPDNAAAALLLANANADLVVQLSTLRAAAALAAASAVTPASQQQQGQKPVPAVGVVVERVGRVRHKEIILPELCIAHFAGGAFTDGRQVGWAIRNTPEECDTWELMLRSQHSLPPSGK